MRITELLLFPNLYLYLSKAIKKKKKEKNSQQMMISGKIYSNYTSSAFQGKGRSRLFAYGSYIKTAINKQLMIYTVHYILVE